MIIINATHNHNPTVMVDTLKALLEKRSLRNVPIAGGESRLDNPMLYALYHHSTPPPHNPATATMKWSDCQSKTFSSANKCVLRFTLHSDRRK